MLHSLLLEYMGALLILTAMMYTNANPIVVGLAYMSALFIGDGKATGYFSPLAVIVQYFFGRLSLSDSLKIVGVHIAAALSVLVLYQKWNIIYTD